MSTVHYPKSEPMLRTGFSFSSNLETIFDRLDEPIALRKGVRIDVPRTIEDALVVPKWKNVVLKEMRALDKNDTWSLMELPQDKSVVGCKWVFTIKLVGIQSGVENIKAGNGEEGKALAGSIGGGVFVWFCSNFKEKESRERYVWPLVNWDNGSFISVRGLKWSAPIGKQRFFGGALQHPSLIAPSRERNECV
ncbi:hypothetical protein CK203_048577 [Vitis vinifera]|uniref:Mitochondrial protein n=1 Tax=Vitis vinifera TaxID=29760 RepID=A0A438HJX9_VITVI|nr:hypothetical protein CK203_048577 [Vitis vinifera]